MQQLFFGFVRKFSNDSGRVFVFCGVFLLPLFISPQACCGATEKTAGYNLIVVSLDTLRADHLSCYGYNKNTSPNIDKLADDGLLFEWAIAQSNFTLPSHASLFTSKYVHTHKADRIERSLSDKELTLAELLRQNGFATAAFIYNARQFDPVYGLSQGFDLYSFGEEEDRAGSFIKTLPAALEWIKAHKSENFFVFLHSNDIHEPYHCEGENFFDPGYKGRLDKEYLGSGNPSFHQDNLKRSAREIKHIIAHYDAGIKYADGFIGDMVKALKDFDLQDKTIIVLLSDHGEVLADRGMRFCHGLGLHDEEVRVPLIIFHPGIKNKGLRISSQAQLIDVMPTVLDFLGIKSGDTAMEGRSLAGLIEGREEKDFNKYAYSECLSGESDKEGIINRQIMVRTDSWKMISSAWSYGEKLKTMPKTIQLHNYAIISLPQESGYELYDLKNDPRERRNLTGKDARRDIRNNIENELLDKMLSVF